MSIPFENNKILKSLTSSFASIGYNNKFMKERYSFSDFLSLKPIDRITDLCVFGLEPFDYRSACFIINFLHDDKNSYELARELRATGAPHIFIILNGHSERWLNRGKEVEKIDEIKTVELAKYISNKKTAWHPSEIIRQKSNFDKPSPTQLDLFIDSGLLLALEYEASKRIDSLMANILFEAENKFKRAKLNLDSKLLFQILFKLLTAKILKDREVKTNIPIDFENFNICIKSVSEFYSEVFINYSKFVPIEILNDISHDISNLISLKNISVDTLTYVYENTFVSPETRKKFGIHSTPSYLAEYILSMIPIENLNPQKLRVYDPTCGHGIFLIAAMRRIRNSIALNWDARKRHNFFTKRLVGTEIDPFSIEVAKMCLTLADFPEANGWKLIEGDIIQGTRLEKISNDTSVLVGNPPFEYINAGNKSIPTPAVLLDRIFTSLPNSAYIGIVLPISFLDSNDYTTQRKFLLETFNILSITNLPSNVFSHSSAETTIVIAKKSKKQQQCSTKYSEIKKTDLALFKSEYKKTWNDEISKISFQENNSILLVPFFRSIWDSLRHLPTLGSIAKMKIGVQNEPRLVNPKKDYKDTFFEGSVQAITDATKGFYQYQATRTKFIPSNKRYQRRFAWNLDWTKPKVIVPAARISVGPWKTAAVIDFEGRYITRNFFAIWPSIPNISVKVIAAILNSPLVAAYIYSNTTERGIPKRIYEKIPIPSNLSSKSSLLEELVDEYLLSLERDVEKCEEILLKLDSEILKLYNLPPKFERKILDLFGNQKRPVPFDFMGYIPPDFLSWIPLYIYISEKYKTATLKNFVEKFPVVKNKTAIHYLKEIG